MIANGSSPRVRGTLSRPAAPAPGCRFIPACAGNSWRVSRRPSRPSVHPRVCGELYSLIAAVQDGVGSSPRVRGTH